MTSIFEPLSVGDLKLANRVVMAPLTRMRATPPGDVPNDLMVEYYRQRAGAGLGPAWDRLVALYQPLIYNLLRGQALPHHAAEELTQEVLLVVFRELGGFVHPGAPGAYRRPLPTPARRLALCSVMVSGLLARPSRQASLTLNLTSDILSLAV